MNRRAAVSLLMPLLFGFLPASAAAPLERLRAATPGRLEVRWSEDGTSVRTLTGRLSAPRRGAPEDVAKIFLEEQREIFGLTPDLGGLKLRGVRSTPGGAHVGYDQVYQGLPVFDGGLDVHLDVSGSVYLVQSAYAAGLDLPTAPRIPAGAATAAAMRQFGAAAITATDKRGQPLLPAGSVRKGHTTGRPELGIFPSDSGPVLVYRVELYAPAPLALVEFFVSATDGSIVLSRNLVQSATDGRGRVFDPNPVVALNDHTLTDHDDADDPSFAAAYVEVMLPQVKRLLSDRLGPYGLMGPYVRIADLIEPPYNMAVTSPDATFNFGRDAQGFEAVMAYFHIDRNQRYIQSLGFTDVNNRAISADPHGVSGMDNSHYVPLPFGAGWVAFGEGGVDDAEDAEVLLHEYGHAIQDNSNPGRFLPFRETGAMGEGFGDYWAFSNTTPGDPDPACIAEWDFQGTCLRRVDGTKHYPEDIAGEVHADGEIWSSTLHGIFESVGKEIADRVILESHFLVPPRPGFCDGALALRQAAANLYGNDTSKAVGQAAAARGIAGDFALGQFAGGPPPLGTIPLRFSVENVGACPVGPARHAVVQFTSATDFVVIQTVETSDLAPGESSPGFEVDLAATPDTVYGVIADFDQNEAEMDESNNVLKLPAVPRLFGSPPAIQSVDVEQQDGEATCDDTAMLEGILCRMGALPGMFQAPFPTETVTVRYTEATLHASVTDPDSTPLVSDVQMVTASYPVPNPTGPSGETSELLLDDGSAGSGGFGGQPGPGTCIDPPDDACLCTQATYRWRSHDVTAGDSLYTHVLALVQGAPEFEPGQPAYQLFFDCALRSKNLFPAAVYGTQSLELTFQAVDREGNQVTWPQMSQVVVGPGSVSCDGDACACCLLMSPNPALDPANGGCSGLAGLPGIPGSGFENGLCRTIF